jgi:hypothetical protein
MLALAGCHSGDPDDGIPSSSPAAPTPSSLAPSAAAERDAVAAYRGMWDAFVEAAKTSDSDDPALRKSAADNALKLIVSGLITNRTLGKVVLGDLKISPRVTRMTPSDGPTTAEITDCVDATNWLEYKKSGKRWDDKPGGKHLTTATVKAVDGSWKVTSFTLRKAGTC